MICIEPTCKKEFEILPKEEQFYKTKNLILPRRCALCRAKRKTLRGGMYHQQGGEHQNTA